MAVEKGIGAGGDAMTPQEQAEIDIIDFPAQPGISEMDDGSVIVGEMVEETTIPVDIPFDANLAEFIDDGDLGRVASEISSDIDDDIASRQDWEESYKRGIDLLGMNYEDRTQPFEGATGVVHPLLAESVTQFQAQAYREIDRKSVV